MSFSLEEFFIKNIKKMVNGTMPTEKGNVYPLLMQEVEKTIIKLTLEETQFNYFKTAKILGISRSKLYRKIKTFELEKIKKSV
jgi:DNA-binding NtrC family response regulator